MEALLDSPAVRLFAACYLILVLKMMLTGGYTSFLRIRRQVYATPEDYALQGLSPSAVADEQIERVRRAHRNDLENVLPFFAVGFFYALSEPSLLAARVGFIGFTLARILHTVCYVRSLQPWRTLAFGVGAVLTLWMLLAGLTELLSQA
jgi:uncharacterized MAPEG superfamily protein